MLNELSVSGTAEINASAAMVWDALTNPAIITKYLFGTKTTTDWKVGNPITFEGVYGDNNEYSYKDKGIVRVFEPLHKISYSYWSGFSGLEDKPQNYSTVTHTLEEKGNATVFTWTQQGFATQEGYEHSRDGMQSFVDSIRDTIEHP